VVFWIPCTIVGGPARPRLMVARGVRIAWSGVVGKILMSRNGELILFDNK
jgi:hypothetical protein